MEEPSVDSALVVKLKDFLEAICITSHLIIQGFFVNPLLEESRKTLEEMGKRSPVESSESEESEGLEHFRTPRKMMKLN